MEMSDAIWVALIAAVPSSLAAITAIRGKRQAKATGDEFREAIYDGNGGTAIGRNVQEIKEAVRNLQDTSHMLVQAQEITAAQIHTNTKETVDLSEKLDRAIFDFQRHTSTYQHNRILEDECEKDSSE
jgi:hypothetical protein